jgi:ATPase family protein associated with various cellular activities (AAA)
VLGAVTVTPAQLPEVLLRIATVRPVHIWGPPGIGKSTLVAGFAAQVGLECVALLGTQLAPEDISGVPQVVLGEDGVPRSRFAPPEQIARREPFVLFLDELNGSSVEVQKAFYQIVLDRRVGAYQLPAGTVVIAAGNRATDQAAVRPMSSALAPILKGTAGWPTAPGDRDILYFLAMSLRARLVKDLPAQRRGASATAVRLAHRGKDLITSMAELSVEYAQAILAGDEDGNPVLPTWFLTEVVRDLPRLVAARTDRTA